MDCSWTPLLKRDECELCANTNMDFKIFTQINLASVLKNNNCTRVRFKNDLHARKLNCCGLDQGARENDWLINLLLFCDSKLANIAGKCTDAIDDDVISTREGFCLNFFKSYALRKVGDRLQRIEFDRLRTSVMHSCKSFKWGKAPRLFTTVRRVKFEQIRLESAH